MKSKLLGMLGSEVISKRFMYKSRFGKSCKMGNSDAVVDVIGDEFGCYNSITDRMESNFKVRFSLSDYVNNGMNILQECGLEARVDRALLKGRREVAGEFNLKMIEAPDYTGVRVVLEAVIPEFEFLCETERTKAILRLPSIGFSTIGSDGELQFKYDMVLEGMENPILIASKLLKTLMEDFSKMYVGLRYMVDCYED